MDDNSRLTRIVAQLLSEDGENVEYDRACADIVAEVLGIHSDRSEDVLEFLRFKKFYNA